MICHPYPTKDEDLNIWKELEADKLPVGKHQVCVSVVYCGTYANFRRNTLEKINNHQCDVK
jgi:hypothetical protein